jgi:Zn-dependent metalloprotease
MKIESVVHYGEKFNNALWNGNKMIYGDGDGQYFNRFTSVIDVCAHELTHAITEIEVGFKKDGEPGALNEHFCDVFTSLVKQYSRGETADQADWLLGKGIFTSNINMAIRSMKSPGQAYGDPLLGKDPQPKHMRDYVQTASGDLGAHINSGIPNHAFYLAATQIGGNAWEKIGKVWYNVLVNGIKYNSNFQHMANLTFDEAGKLFGIDSGEQYAIQNAWEEVGITCSSESYENASYQAHKDYQSYGTQPHTDSKERFRAH